jgi:O-antigen/teichoic acid export membrane protein
MSLVGIYFVKSLLSSNNIRFKIARIDKQHTLEIIRFSLPLFISGFVMLPAYWIVNTRLALLTGFAQLGLLKIGRNLYNIFLSLPQILNIPLLPMITEIHKKDKEKAKKTIIKIIRVVMILVLPITLLLGICSKALIWILFGTSYIDAYEITFYFMLAAFLVSLSPIVSTLFVATSKTWTILLLDIFYSLVFIVSGYFFIAYFGLLGVGFTYLFATLLFFLLELIFLKKIFDIDLKPIMSILLLFTISSIIGFFIISLDIILNAIFGALTIMALVIVEYLLLTVEEKTMIKMLLDKIKRKTNHIFSRPPL